MIVDNAAKVKAVDEIVQKKVLLIQRVQLFDVKADLIKTEQEFERRIFPQDESEQKATRRFSADLDLAIHKIDRACSLSNEQRKRLALAGRVDQQRFFQRVEEVRKRIRRERFITDDQAIEFENLQKISQTGLLGPTSFFSKAVRTTLSPEQLKVSQELHHNALVEKTVDEIERQVGLLQLQRDFLVKLMREEIPAFAVFWSDKSSYERDELKEMRYQLSLAEEKIRPVLGDGQWNSLKTMIEHFDEPKQEQL